MIRLNKIVIRDFRGIRDLELVFGRKNFAICGPNGTGKSGIVDALEFALTGVVSRLSGEGRGEVSLKQHGPHVDIRNDPDKARVTIEAFIPSINRSVTVERSLKNPSIPKVIPSDPLISEVLDQVRSHPEIVLSRRELIRYILATPGKRADEVQALLHLDRVEQVRVGLQKIANSCEKQKIPYENAVAQAKENLLRAVGISHFIMDDFLRAANSQRAILGLPQLAELSASTSLKDGMATPAPLLLKRIPKTQAIADVKAARDALSEITSVTNRTSMAEIGAELAVLAEDSWVLTNLKRETLFSTAIELIDESVCPLCGKEWDLAELKSHIQTQLARLQDISKTRKTIEARLAPIITAISRIKSAIETLINYAELAVPPLSTEILRAYNVVCTSAISSIKSFLPIADTINVLTSVPNVPSGVLDAIESLDKMIADLPEPTKQDAARDWLTIAQERLGVWREEARRQSIADRKAETARKVYDIYARTSDRVLAGLYAAVEQDFAMLYAMVNRDDEGKFSAKLIPSMGKLGFDVDFYGRGFFPPGAYHSEGHQDGMGLCLYLALMRYIHGSAFTLAILDDVLMSVDAGHRREVCTMLKQEFPRTQFIITTHDPIWLRHMRTDQIIDARSFVQFRTWSVDNGPTRWDGRDVWAEINDYCDQNDIHAAAGLLRRFLEYESAELCHRLRAPVAFRADAQYQLGELLPSAINHLRNLFNRAKDAANSWNQRDLIQKLHDYEVTFNELVAASNAERWQVNVAIHYNSWDNLGKQDFKPVVSAFRELLGGFSCRECGDYLRVSPERDDSESFRCECGVINFNIRKKPKS